MRHKTDRWTQMAEREERRLAKALGRQLDAIDLRWIAKRLLWLEHQATLRLVRRMIREVDTSHYKISAAYRAALEHVIERLIARTERIETTENIWCRLKPAHAIALFEAEVYRIKEETKP